MTETLTRKEVLQDVAKELREFDFQSFDPRKDKNVLLDKLQYINSQLGNLLKGFV